MGAFGDIMLGGLLGGLGKGVSDIATQRREDALAALKAQQDDADKQQLFAQQTSLEKMKIQGASDLHTQEMRDKGTLLVQGASLDVARDTNRIKLETKKDIIINTLKHSQDISLADVNAKLDMLKDSQKQQLTALIAGGQVDQWKTGADGKSLVAVFKDPNKQPQVFSGFPQLAVTAQGDGSGGSSVADLIAQRQGKTTTPSVAATDTPASPAAPATYPVGTIATNAQGHEMIMSASGKWIPHRPGS